MGAYETHQMVAKTLELRDRFKVTKFYETGTDRGESTAIVAPHFDKVFTYEVNEPVQRKSAAFLAEHHPNVTARLCRSVDGLEQDLNDSDAIVFLDAHASNDHPLHEELALIARKGLTPVIIIHDFFVPDGNGGAKFGYDVYGGHPNDVEYVRPGLDAVYGKDGWIMEYGTEVGIENKGVAYVYKKS